jgi:hypothetical protein
VLRLTYMLDAGARAVDLLDMNWKTTLSSVLAAIGTALSAPGVLPAPWGMVAQMVAAAALAAFGAVAADAGKNTAPKK